MSPSARARLVIGIGNSLRGDDAAGLACIGALRGRLARDIELIESDGEPAGLLARLARAAEAHLIDASVSAAPPGTVRCFDALTQRLPRLAGAASTHGLGLSETLELARALGALPARCLVYAIEGASYAPGAPLSDPVRAAIARVARQIARACAS